VEVMTVGLNGLVIRGSHNIYVEADTEIDDVDFKDLEMIILPGGLGGVASIRGCQAAMDAVRFAYENGKYTAAICAGPTVLADLGIPDGKNATCYPGCEDKMRSAKMVNAAAVTDGKLITGTSAGCAIPFGLALIAALKGQDDADRIEKQIVIR
jgi:4-methyl-5(b-hydroxyethyl)-thiazole monophosphate biosynthesis